MNPERWAQIKSIFYDAAEKPADQQAAFVRSRCDGDESLALEIESLLSAHEQAGEFIEDIPADAATVAMTVQLTDALIGSHIGSYEVIRNWQRRNGRRLSCKRHSAGSICCAQTAPRFIHPRPK